MERLEFLSGVLLVSTRPERLAAFYRDVLNVPLEAEEHEGTLPHWGCTLGDVHFAVHPVEDFPDGRSGVGAVKLAFTVFDLASVVQSLREKGVSLLKEPEDTGFFVSAMLEDPDGNLVELTQLVDDWFRELDERRARGQDVLARWKARRSP
jgi:catechol-2,3-dioxygenase